MGILFLTSCLAPGQDGVGDYTRRLAFECVRQNQACRLIALNDLLISDPVESTESEGGLRIPTLRLPASLAWPQRIERAAAFRGREPLEWTSLQFVAYGFDRKGLVRNLARHLEPIVAGGLLHIMFHELWIGVGPSPPLKDRVVGQIQRYYIQELLRRLQPRLVTTTNPFYLSMLTGIGTDATELPLFGNIPFSPSQPARAPGLSQGLFFGSLYPEWEPEPFMSIWIAASAKAGKRPQLISAGRLGASGEAVWKKLRTRYAHAVDFTALGECSAPAVSELMQRADFGLAASPWHLLGKSGSAVAMLDHGLPVIVTRAAFRPAAPASRPGDPLLHPCDATLESKLLAGLPKRPARDRVADVARDFIRQLTESTAR